MIPSNRFIPSPHKSTTQILNEREKEEYFKMLHKLEKDTNLEQKSKAFKTTTGVR